MDGSLILIMNKFYQG